MEPLTQVPRVPWSTIHSRISRSLADRPGDGSHITLVGPTGCGKTHLAVELLDLWEYHLVLATKRKDPLVHELRAHGYHVTGDLAEIQWDGRLREPIQKRIVYWPSFPEKMTTKQRIAAQSQAMSRAMDWADKTGGWAVLVDETMWMHDQLRLERELSAMWYQGRTQGLSVIACAQRPSRVPRLAWNQADFFFVWATQDKTDLESLRDISSSIPRELIEETIRNLDADEHEALFIDAQHRELARVVAPPR